VAAAAGLAGWSAGGATKTEPVHPAPARQAVALGPATLSVDGSWRRSERSPAGVRPEPNRIAVFEPLSGLSVSAILALAPIEDSTLVPPALAAMLREPLPQPRKTTVAGLPAWRYGDLATGGQSTMMDLTVVPTSAGTIALACVAPSSLWSVASDCAAGLRAVALEGARPLVPDADLALRLHLPAVIPMLDRRRVRHRHALRRAQSARAQARAAARLADAHRGAARRLAPAAAADGASADAVAALERLAVAYRELAVSARQELPRAFAGARSDVRRGEAALAAALDRLR
jgi:hypothetical protein